MRLRFGTFADCLRTVLTGILPTCALLLFLALSMRPAAAQVLFGSVVGNVTDASGAAVPGANVKITESQTNETRTGVTNDAGAYTIATVPAGTYQVEIIKQGFRGFVTSDILVNQNNVVRVDAQLQVGTQSEKIEVTAEAAVLQTDRADIHAEVSNQSFENMPQPNRTYEGLLATVPGVTFAGSQLGGGTNNPSKALQFEFNGTGIASAQVRVEGVSANNPWQYYNTSYVPSIEAVENVNVATNATDSEQALSGGASVNVRIKSGSNSTHGAVYAYNINSRFEANNFFALAGSKPPQLNENNDGGNLGGHIIRNKLFYFGSYEGDYLHGANSGIQSFPAPAQLRGDFTASPTPIYDPSTGAANGTGRTPFPGNIIPGNLINPIIAKIIPLIPPTNLPGSINNMYLNLPAIYNLHKIDAKVDYNTSSKLRISGRFGDQPYYSKFGPMYGDILGGAGGPGGCGACNYLQNGATKVYSASATYVASPSFVIDTTFGTTRPHQLLFPTQTNVKYGSDVLGISGTNTGPLPWAGGVPNFSISNYATMGYSYPALEYLQPSYEYSANASKIKGSHTIRFGTDIFRIDMNHIEISPTAFTFSGGVTSLNGGPASNQYNALADFLLGLPTSDSNYTQVAQPYLTLRTWDFAIYARDQWQISRKVTLNYGVRWEYYPVPLQDKKGINLYDPSTNIIQECGVGGIPNDCGITVSKRLFAPSVGVAYRAFKNFVIRAGFALNPLQDLMARGGMKSFPEEVGAIFNGPNSYTSVGSVSNGIPIVTAPAAVNGQVFVPAGTGSLFTVSKNYIRGYTESANFTVQKEFGNGWTVQAGWVGTHALHEYTQFNINYGQLGGGSASQPLAKYGITASTSQVQPFGSDIYHSLQTMLNKRFAHGFTTHIAYTFSKDIGMNPTTNNSGSTILIPQYRFYDRYPSTLDRTHTFIWTNTYELPFGKGRAYLKQGPASWIAGGWTVNGLFTHSSGTPFSVTASATSCNCPGNTQPANQILPTVTQVGNGLAGQPYFNPLAYGNVTTVAFGTAGFDRLRGPGTTNLDLNIFRDFPVTERIKIQIRGEAFNIANHPHFSNPGANVSNMSLNADGSIKSLGGFSQITSTAPLGRLIDARYFRFGVRLMF